MTNASTCANNASRLADQQAQTSIADRPQRRTLGGELTDVRRTFDQHLMHCRATFIKAVHARLDPLDIPLLRSTMMSFSLQPLELLDTIASFVPLPSDLFSLALTSKALCSIIIPQHIEFREVCCDPRREMLWRLLADRLTLSRRITSRTVPRAVRVSSTFNPTVTHCQQLQRPAGGREKQRL